MVGLIQRTVNYWLLQHGFSIGIGDTVADDKTMAVGAVPGLFPPGVFLACFSLPTAFRVCVCVCVCVCERERERERLFLC